MMIFMIMRITVHDSKYINQLRSFVSALLYCDMHYEIQPDECQIVSDRCHYDYLWQRMINGDITDCEINELITVIKSKFLNYCKDYPLATLTDTEQIDMLRGLSISFAQIISYKNENNAVIYVFPKALSDYNQMIVL